MIWMVEESPASIIATRKPNDLQKSR
jgi:hypothetical protein